MTELMITLLMWIAANSAYSVPAEGLPGVEFGTQAQIRNLVYGDRASEYEYKELFGAYDYRVNVVYLHDKWDIKKKEHHGGLLHELVHFLQHKHNKEFSCDAGAQKEAYELEDKWYNENNVPSPHDPAFILVVKLSCRGA